MTHLNTSNHQTLTRKGDRRRPEQLLRDLALNEANGFQDIMALVRQFSETQLSTPLKDGKCREKAAALLGYPKYSLFRKDYMAKHALRAAISKLNLDELRLTLDKTYRKNIDMYLESITQPSNQFNVKLREVYSEWIKRLEKTMEQRDIQADGEAMLDYLSHLCGVTPRVRINETQFFKQCNPEQLAMDHIHHHGLFLSPRNQGEGKQRHDSENDFKIAVCPNAFFLHKSDAIFGRWKDEHNKTWRLHIHATADNILTLSTLQIALNQIHLLCPALEQCYLLPEHIPETLTQFFDGKPKYLTLQYTVPEHGQAPKSVVLGFGRRDLMFFRHEEYIFAGHVNIEPQPIPVNTRRHTHIQPDYPILD